MFANRDEAGRRLARRLQHLAGRTDVIVLALPRGGVPVGFAVAKELMVPLDVFIVRKIGVPGHEELAMGAIASGGTIIRNQDVIDYMSISESDFRRVASLEEIELARREREFRDDRTLLALRGKTVILVDDGIATGASMQAAAAAIRSQKPRSLIVAAPVGSPSVRPRFASLADDVVFVVTPGDFQAVGAWYEDFTQTTDEEVRELLRRAKLSRLRPGPPDAGHPRFH